MSFITKFMSNFNRHMVAMALFASPVSVATTAHAQTNWGDRLVDVIVDSSARQLCKNIFDADNTHAARGVCRGYSERALGDTASMLGFNYQQNGPLSLTFNNNFGVDDNYWDNYFNANSRGYFLDDGYATMIVDYSRCSSAGLALRNEMYGREDPSYCNGYPMEYKPAMERGIEERLGRNWARTLTNTQ